MPSMPLIYFMFDFSMTYGFYSVQLVMGGPFEPHIESILRQKALLMNSPVISAFDLGIQSSSKVLDKVYQSCDLIIQVEKDLQLV